MWEFQKQFTLLYPQHWPCLGKSSDRVAVTSMSQSGLNYMVPVKQKITCIPSPQDSFGVGHSYSTFAKAWMIHTPVQPQEVFGPFLASSVHGQSNHMWLRVWHSHLGSGGKSNIWDTKMKRETVMSCKACSRHRDKNRGIITLSSLTVLMASATSSAVCLQTIKCRTVHHKDWLLW